jgi:metal-responsive CopG/Arc/MetJ family transcriptional regulator
MPVKPVSVALSQRLLDSLDAEAQGQERTRSQLIRRILEEHFRRQETERAARGEIPFKMG